MQHLDEGTIHSWLDGALAADEAARVEAHVKECRECAAAVAEARGFIAASSRILTALDNAPRGVVPAAAPIRRRNWPVWRAAAAVLVVAGGSLVVLRNTGSEPKVLHSRYETSDSSLGGPGGPASAASSQNTATVPEPASPRTLGRPSGKVAIGSTQPKVAAREQSTDKTTTTDAVTSTLKAAVPAPQVNDQREVRAPAFQPTASVAEGTALSGKVGGVAEKRSASAGYSAPTEAPAAVLAAPPAAAATAQSLGMVRLRGASMNAVIDSAPLKVVGTPRRIGAKVTLYEVAPGDTVTLMESMTLSLEAVVVTGMSTRPAQQGATEKSASAPSRARADAASNAAADSQRAAAAVPAPAAATSRPRPSTVEISDGVTTISWRDATTGNELKLSGRLPVAQLQLVKIRIERERAAAAAARKTP